MCTVRAGEVNDREEAAGGFVVGARDTHNNVVAVAVKDWSFSNGEGGEVEVRALVRLDGEAFRFWGFGLLRKKWFTGLVGFDGSSEYRAEGVAAEGVASLSTPLTCHGCRGSRRRMMKVAIAKLREAGIIDVDVN
jgi:hypothetical protein